MGNDGGERRAVPFRSLAGAGLAITVLAVAGALLAYFELLHYRRRAVEHLPARAELVARLEVEQIVLFDPVRKHLLPLVDSLPFAVGENELLATPPPAERLGRLRQEAGLNLGLDLREVLVASAEAGNRWVVVLGGLFPSRGLLPKIEQVLRGEPASGWTRAGGALEFTPSGLCLGQAEDGVLVLASDRETLRESLVPSTQFQTLGLPREGTGAAVLTQPALARLFSKRLPLERASLVLRLGNEIEADAALDFPEPLQAAAFAREWPASPGLSALGAPIDTSAPWPLSGRVERVEASGSRVKLTAYVRQAELERAARGLAAWVQRRWAQGAHGGPGSAN